MSMVHHRENVGEFEILVSLLVGSPLGLFSSRLEAKRKSSYLGLIGLMSTLDTLLTDMGFG